MKTNLFSPWAFFLLILSLSGAEAATLTQGPASVAFDEEKSFENEAKEEDALEQEIVSPEEGPAPASVKSSEEEDAENEGAIPYVDTAPRENDREDNPDEEKRIPK